MKTVLLCLLMATAALTSGCIFMNDEDRDFYGKGWVNPHALDTPTPHHKIPDPSRPQQETTAPSRTASTEPAPEWLTPETETPTMPSRR